MTEELQALLNRMTAMVEDYNTRTQAAADRIVTLGSDLQQAKEAMNAAAAADAPAAYQEAEARVRFLSARIEAAKRKQVEPLFASTEEADALDHEYRRTLHAAVKSIYARLLETLDAQKGLLAELQAIETAVHSPVVHISKHAYEVGRAMSPWMLGSTIRKFFSSGAYLETILQEVVDK